MKMRVGARTLMPSMTAESLAASFAKWPASYTVMKKMQLTDAQYAALISRLELDGVPVKQVADEWLDANEETWSKWK